MPKEPSHPTRQEIEQVEETHRRFEADAISCQRNVLPMDEARNVGRFYGQIIRGERPLNAVQRIGCFLLGNLFFWGAITVVIGAFPRFFSVSGPRLEPIGGKSVSMVYLPFAAASLFLGLKIIAAAITPHRHKL
jgi:hypothetical protein